MDVMMRDSKGPAASSGKQEASEETRANAIAGVSFPSGAAAPTPTSPPSDEREDKRLLVAEYDLGKELGAGGFSTVRLATNKKTGQKVAVKTLCKLSNETKGHLEADDLAMIRNEVMIVSYLADHIRHPNVVSLVDIFEEDTKVHLLQELCTGGELFYRIELKLQQVHLQMQKQLNTSAQDQALFSERDAAVIIQQVASALHELHKKGIIHRDVKPENLLYESTCPASPIKITDFGLSYKEGTDDPMKSRLLGSIDYIAPEVLTRRWYTKAGDMWSLGVITYILLGGSPPFGAHNTTAKLQKIIGCNYDFDHQVWHKISDSAKDLISKLLVLDAHKRYTCEQVLGHPWITGESGYSEIQLTDTLKGIKNFNAKRKFRAAALACIHIHRAKMTKFHNLGGSSVIGDGGSNIHFSPKQIEDLKNDFKKVCGAKTTVIDFKSFEKVMAKRLPKGQEASSSTEQSNTPLVHRLFELFDTNGDGAVDLREFIIGLGAMQSESGEDRVKMCFKTYDVDDSGYISRDELAKMLASVTFNNEMLASFDLSKGKSSPRGHTMCRPCPRKKRKQTAASKIAVSGDSGAGGSALAPGGPKPHEDPISLSYNIVRNTSFHAELLTELFERLDRNNDGKISYDEFKEGINRDPFLIDVLFGSN